MLKRLKIFPVILTIALSQFTILSAGFPIAINSGNPAFPFPQFLPYDIGDRVYKNLATHNGAGVPHAEMEQIIRDAYQIMMNRCEHPGGGVGGVKYVHFKSNPDVSEGDGYAMLAAAYMADKQTFDGLWLWVHDHRMNKVVNYQTGKPNNPNYAYSVLPSWVGHKPAANSAADGDFDIALALHVAYMQWGESMGINDATGKTISYKHDLIQFLKGLTDTISYAANSAKVVSGDIGLDGYFKGGDSWQELTDWASHNLIFGKPPECNGPQKQHSDYAAPAYFHAFAQFLKGEDPVKYKWNIYQFERAEASSDWLMGELYKQNIKNIPYVGWVEPDGSHTKFKFSIDNQGEDFRHPWRHILNELWHGNPKTTWNPVTHQVEPGANSFEMDMGIRFAKFLKKPQAPPWNNPCDRFGDFMPYWGIAALRNQWDMDGTNGRWFHLNWMHGTGSPSIVISGDVDLMAEDFRQLELKFDATGYTVEGSTSYLDKIPFYFHGWFRLLGMMVLSGNHHTPLVMKPSANMKVYLDVDKTFAFERDVLTYEISYRNYGSVDAQNVVISDTLHKDFVFVSATGGGRFDPASRTVTWNISNVPGFKTGTGVNSTQGAVQLKVKINEATQDQYANRAVISCANGTGWISGDYPNNITSVMERNLVDIARRALVIKNSVDKPLVKPGEEVHITINFENTTKAGWINGGRPGIHYAYGHSDTKAVGADHIIKFQLYHDADESYIELGNYRISYFLFDSTNNCLSSDPGCTDGWNFMPHVIEGVSRDGIKFLHEPIVPGQDSRGKWNQRLIVQSSDPTDPNRKPSLIMTNHQLELYRGSAIAMHKGGKAPLRLILAIANNKWQNVRWDDDWSWDPAAKSSDTRFWPVTNDFSDIYNPNQPVTTWHPKLCVEADHTINNVLVEEWDGYTWRRVAGNGPLPGRDAFNVVVTDTIPAGLSFMQFTSSPPLGIQPQIDGRVITWKIPRMQIAQKGTISYKAKAEGSCPMNYKQIIPRAWIQADLESPISSAAILTVSCSDLPAAAPPVANPPGYTFYDNQISVSLATSTPGGGIYYTLDGSTPVPGQPDTKTYVPGAPIIIKDSTVLTAVTILAGYEPSSLMVENYFSAELVPTDSAKMPTAASTLNTSQTPYTNTIRLATETPGALIYYTLDGTLPDPEGKIGTLVYDAANPIVITSLTTINAIAVKRGMFPSPVMTKKFSVIQKVATPAASPFALPVYIIPQGGPKTLPVTLTCITAGASIFYTLDGSDPDTLATGVTKKYTQPIIIGSNITIKAIAVLPGWLSSDILRSEYKFINKVSTPVASPFKGPTHVFTSTHPSKGAISVKLSVETDSAVILYTTDGTEPQASPGGSTILDTGQLIVVNKTLTIKAIAVRPNWQPSAVMIAPYQKIIVLPKALQAWMIDGNKDGRGDRVFVRFAEPIYALPDSGRFGWPDKNSQAKLRTKEKGLSIINENILVADFTDDSFPFGMTWMDYQNPPFAVLSDGQKININDSLGAVITSAEIVEADFHLYRYLNDPTETVHIMLDTLVIGLSEPLLALDAAQIDKNNFLMVRTGCKENAVPVPLILDTLSDLFTAKGFNKLRIPLRASGTFKQIGYGDCVFLNPNSGYTDMWGNNATALEQKVTGSASEHRNFKSTLVRPVEGGGNLYKELILPKPEEIVVIDANGNIVSRETSPTISQWIPPLYMKPNGEIDKQADINCSPAPPKVKKDLPPNCLSTVAVVSEGPYEASIKIYDHLGKFIHTSHQRFGFCEDIKNEERKRPDGFLSFLVWNLKDMSGKQVGSGVYIWHVDYVFRSGLRRRINIYKQGLSLGEVPVEGCAAQ